MHLAKPHGEHKNMSEAKFQAGDMVLIDVVARSGARKFDSEFELVLKYEGIGRQRLGSLTDV